MEFNPRHQAIKTALTSAQDARENVSDQTKFGAIRTFGEKLSEAIGEFGLRPRKKGKGETERQQDYLVALFELRLLTEQEYTDLDILREIGNKGAHGDEIYPGSRVKALSSFERLARSVEEIAIPQKSRNTSSPARQVSQPNPARALTTATDRSLSGSKPEIKFVQSPRVTSGKPFAKMPVIIALSIVAIAVGNHLNKGNGVSVSNAKVAESVSVKDSCFGTVYRKTGCGQLPDLYIGGWGDYYYDYVLFDLRKLPPLSQGQRAEIWFWGSAPNDPVMNLERITENWSESNISLHSNPSSVFVTIVSPFGEKPEWVKTDITSLYNSWKSNRFPNYGIKLTPTHNEQTNGSIASSENSNLAVRPRLVIVDGR